MDADFEGYKGDVVKFAKLVDAAARQGKTMLARRMMDDILDQASEPGFVGLTMRHRRPVPRLVRVDGDAV